MESLSRTPPMPPVAAVLGFLGLFLAVYVAAATVAEFRVGREGAESAFQKILAAEGTQYDWVVLGASHALPLAFGGIPARLETETGQRMIVLAEVGAGPLYSDFVLRQAMTDLRPRRILYVVDSFGFRSPRWNEARIADRKLLRKTPLRPSTLATMGNMVLSQGVPASAVLDYVTAFSKLNPPDRFPQDDWRGAADFDRTFRPSRHATASRIDYLYPDPVSAETTGRYLDLFGTMIARARTAGLAVVVVKLPVPEAFRAALPDEAAFDAALHARLEPLGVPLHDLSAALDDPALYFDTDHLNREGTDRLYRDYLKAILVTD
jgi:hypothetical protein